MRTPKVVSSVIKQLETEFAKEAPLTVTQGKIHEFLGKTLDFNIKGKVQIKMIDYIESMLKDLPPDMDREAATPVSNHLLNTEDLKVLDKD